MVAADRLGHGLLRGTLRGLQQGRVGEQRVEAVEQVEVPLAAQLLEHPGPRLGVPYGAAQPVLERAGDQVAGQFGEEAGEAGVEHFAVAFRAEHSGEPFQLLADGVGDRPVQLAAVRLQGAAQPPGGHPHLVHGVGLVPPYQRVVLGDVPHTPVQIPEDVVARGVQGGGRLGQGGHAFAQRPAELGGEGGPAEFRVRQPLLDRVQQLPFPVEEFDLHLGPGDGLARRPGRPGGWR